LKLINNFNFIVATASVVDAIKIGIDIYKPLVQIANITLARALISDN
jgi:hypothetical protein